MFAEKTDVHKPRQNHIRSIFAKLAAILGHDDATRVEIADVNNFKKLLLATPNSRNGKKLLTRNTVKQTLSVLKSSFQ